MAKNICDEKAWRIALYIFMIVILHRITVDQELQSW